MADPRTPGRGPDGPYRSRDNRLPLGEPTPRDLLREMTDDVRDIVRLEVQLARAELQESLIEARRAAIALSIAGGLATLGAIMLPFAAAWALGLVLPMWAAALIVAGAFLLAGGIFFAIGRSRLNRVDLRPERTLQTLQGFGEDRTWNA